MVRIFEIPIYALSKKVLKERSEKYIAGWKFRNVPAECPEETIKRVVEMQFFPQRVWEYNHIVGYIEICVNGQDIEYNAYMPYKDKKKYCWWTKQKTLLMKDMWNNAHFRVEDKYSNLEIQNMVADTLSELIREHITGKRVVDRTAFDNINKNLDYRNIIDGGNT